MIRIAQVCAEQLLLLINDILDLTKIQANKMTLENRAFPLYSVITEAIEVVTVAVTQKATLDVVWILDDSLSVGDMIVGDALRLRQSQILLIYTSNTVCLVLVNLLSNAIKFSKSGVILLSASVKSQQDERLEIQISVSDEVHDLIHPYMMTLK
jgi:signal transduction histidine kinase